ncbi:MAG: hypothetical protein ACPL7I_07305 [Myxococcota bacterium]
MKIYFLIFIFIFLVIYGATCGTQGAMSESNQKYINEVITNNRYFLKSSLYYGDFYGNKEICLLSNRKFSETIYLVGIDGKPILPGEEKGIIPFNTEVLIEKIEFPPSNRPIFTPRYYPWVYLKVDRLSGYKSCIVVIRPDVSKPDEFLALFDELFSKNNNEQYLKKINTEIRDAIFNKKFVVGATEGEIRIIFGKPDSIEYKRENNENITIYDYSYFRVLFKDGKSFKYEEAGGKR